MSFPARMHGRIAGAAVGLAIVLVACAPQRPYRTRMPPSRASTAEKPTLPSPPARPPAASREAAPKPLPPEPEIREQNLQTKPQPSAPPILTFPSLPGKDPDSSAAPTDVAPVSPPLPDDSSLLAKITPGVSPQRAASLRLTDEGSKLLDAGEPAKALMRLERTIVIDASNAYGYFYLAKAHFRLGRYGESLNFLAVAESRLSAEPFWLSEVHALRGENYRAQGQLQRAESSYQEAVRLNSGNRVAAEALARLQVESRTPSR